MPLDDTDVPAPRLVGLACDHGDGEECDARIECDVLARSFAEALPALIEHGRAHGWEATDDGAYAYCPDHHQTQEA